MIDLLQESSDLLSSVGFGTTRMKVGSREALVFEDTTVLGFLFAYQNPIDLVWQQDSDLAIADYQFALRRAGQKAWNTYLILLAAMPGGDVDAASLAAIEEDLAGTRKIARMDVRDPAEVRAALLPLLPLQAAPKLEAVNIPDEIRQRATELPTRVVDAFLSSADESVVMQVMEESS
jgi:hypothetical protein